MTYWLFDILVILDFNKDDSKQSIKRTNGVLIIKKKKKTQKRKKKERKKERKTGAENESINCKDVLN